MREAFAWPYSRVNHKLLSVKLVSFPLRFRQALPYCFRVSTYPRKCNLSITIST